MNDESTIAVARRCIEQLQSIQTFLRGHGCTAPTLDDAVALLIGELHRIGSNAPASSTPDPEPFSNVPTVDHNAEGHAVKWSIPGLHFRPENPERNRNDD